VRPGDWPESTLRIGEEITAAFSSPSPCPLPRGAREHWTVISRTLLTSFWVVPEQEFLGLYRFLLTQVRHAPAPRALAPIMHQDLEQLVWDNSIGFLRSDGQLFKR
jgi:hypothetical protein